MKITTFDASRWRNTRQAQDPSNKARQQLATCVCTNSTKPEDPGSRAALVRHVL